MPRVPANTEYRGSAAFRKRILAIMEDSDCFSNRAFAERTGVSLPVIARAALFGIVPTTRALVKIADALELSFSYLLGSTEKNEFIPSAAPSSFAARLEELRKERKITYGAIAQSMPFPRTYFYEWRKDNTLPSPEYLLAIASYFAVSPDYLLGRTDYRN